MNKFYCVSDNKFLIPKGTLFVFNEGSVEDMALYEQLKNHLQEINVSDVSNLAGFLATKPTNREIDVYLDKINLGEAI